MRRFEGCERAAFPALAGFVQHRLDLFVAPFQTPVERRFAQFFVEHLGDGAFGFQVGVHVLILAQQR